MKRPGKKNITAALDEPIVEALAGALRPTELSAAQRSAMRDRIVTRIASTQPANTETVRAEAVEWMSVWPNVWVKLLRLDAHSNSQMLLLRIKPGGVVPAHVHTKEEECLVLEGEIHIGSHPLGTGDLHIARPGAEHADITTRSGATVLVRSEIPPEYLQKLLATSEHSL